MHPIELHTQVGDAGAFALACLELQQVGAVVGGDRTQLVKLGIVAHGDDATIPHHRGGLLCDGTDKQWLHSIGRGQALIEFLEVGVLLMMDAIAQLLLQRWQNRQCLTQAGQLSWSNRQQSDAGGDALKVWQLGQQPAQRLYYGLGVQHAFEVLFGLDQAGNSRLPMEHIAVAAQRVVQPAPQHPASHGRAAVVQHGKQRGRVLS